MELVTHVRCKDPWYAEVLKKLRQGRMTADMFNFLRGYPTPRNLDVRIADISVR